MYLDYSHSPSDAFPPGHDIAVTCMRPERSDIHRYIKMRTYTNDVNQDLPKRARLQIQMTVNNTEVTVNTYTCRDVLFERHVTV